MNPTTLRPVCLRLRRLFSALASLSFALLNVSLFANEPAANNSAGKSWMELKGAGSPVMINGYFTAPGSQRALAVGDSITVSMMLALSATEEATDSCIRIGIYNSNGNRLTADEAATSINDNARFNGYAGYGVYFNPRNSTEAATEFKIMRKTNADKAGVPTVTNGWALNRPAPTPNLGISANVPFPVSITVKRTSATAVAISVRVKDTTADATDKTATVATAFDTICIFASSTGLTKGQTAKVSDVTVAYTKSGGKAQFMLKDSFVDGERANQSLPESAAWFLRIQSTTTKPSVLLYVTK